MPIDEFQPGLFTFDVDFMLRSNYFTAGDFVPNKNCITCLPSYGYHVCELHPAMRMLQALAAARWKKYYEKLKQEISENGLVAPLSAKIGHDGEHMVLIDGHTRLAAAVELDISCVSVYVATYDTPRSALVAGDSSYWTKGVDSPWLIG